MNKKGFTLIELLVVIAIVSILSSIIIPNVSKARDKARIAAGKTTASTVGSALAISEYKYISGYWKTTAQQNFGVVPTILSDSFGLTGTVSNPTSTTVLWSTESPIEGGSSLEFTADGYSFGHSSILTNQYNVRANDSTGMTTGVWLKRQVLNQDLGVSLLNRTNPVLVATGIKTAFQVSTHQSMVYNPSTNTYHTIPHSFPNDTEWHYLLGVLKYGEYARIYIDGKKVGELKTNLPASASEYISAGLLSPNNTFDVRVQRFNGTTPLVGYVADPFFINQAIY